MGLTKAIIKVEREKKPVENIPVLFNPNEYTIQSKNKTKEEEVPGLQSPISQFSNGGKRQLLMDLFFDTTYLNFTMDDWDQYEGKEDEDEITFTDVRFFTKQITNLLVIDEGMQQPPICTFQWGKKMLFKGYLEDVTEKYTMFRSSGRPVRATLSVTFTEVVSIEEQTKKMALDTADRSKQFVLKQDEQLWMVAHREYDNPQKWREIADANNIDNPLFLETGATIIVPRLG